MPRDSRQANDSPRRITWSRSFRPVCIVFISPPLVELCILPLYCACFVRNMHNTQILLDYKLEYEIDVDLHRESGIINVMSAFFA